MALNFFYINVSKQPWLYCIVLCYISYTLWPKNGFKHGSFNQSLESLCVLWNSLTTMTNNKIYYNNINYVYGKNGTAHCSLNQNLESLCVLWMCLNNHEGNIRCQTDKSNANAIENYSDWVSAQRLQVWYNLAKWCTSHMDSTGKRALSST